MKKEEKVVLLKIKDLSVELINLIDAMTKDEAVPTVNEEPKKVVTLVEVRTALAKLSRDGFTSEVRSLLKKYGADKLSGINEKDYEALLEDAKNLKVKEGE